MGPVRKGEHKPTQISTEAHRRRPRPSTIKLRSLFSPQLGFCNALSSADLGTVSAPWSHSWSLSTLGSKAVVRYLNWDTRTEYFRPFSSLPLSPSPASLALLWWSVQQNHNHMFAAVGGHWHGSGSDVTTNISTLSHFSRTVSVFMTPSWDLQEIKLSWYYFERWCHGINIQGRGVKPERLSAPRRSCSPFVCAASGWITALRSPCWDPRGVCAEPRGWAEQGRPGFCPPAAPPARWGLADPGAPQYWGAEQAHRHATCGSYTLACWMPATLGAARNGRAWLHSWMARGDLGKDRRWQGA